MAEITYILQDEDRGEYIGTVVRDTVPRIGETVYFSVLLDNNILFDPYEVVDVHYVEQINPSQDYYYDLHSNRTDVRVILKSITDRTEIPLLSFLCRPSKDKDILITAQIKAIIRILKKHGEMENKEMLTKPNPLENLKRIFGDGIINILRKRLQQVEDDGIDNIARDLLDQIDWGDD